MYLGEPGMPRLNLNRSDVLSSCCLSQPLLVIAFGQFALFVSFSLTLFDILHINLTVQICTDQCGYIYVRYAQGGKYGGLEPMCVSHKLQVKFGEINSLYVSKSLLSIASAFFHCFRCIGKTKKVFMPLTPSPPVNPIYRVMFETKKIYYLLSLVFSLVLFLFLACALY